MIYDAATSWMARFVVEEISTRISLRAGERLTVGEQSTILVSVGAR
jgi:hypothetical protein